MSCQCASPQLDFDPIPLDCLHCLDTTWMISIYMCVCSDPTRFCVHPLTCLSNMLINVTNVYPLLHSSLLIYSYTLSIVICPPQTSSVEIKHLFSQIKEQVYLHFTSIASSLKEFVTMDIAFGMSCWNPEGTCLYHPQMFSSPEISIILTPPQPTPQKRRKIKIEISIVLSHVREELEKCELTILTVWCFGLKFYVIVVS